MPTHSARSPPGSAAVEVDARSALPGGISCRTALAVLGAAELVGADLDAGSPALADLSAEQRPRPAHAARMPDGRDHADRRELQRQSGLDEGGAGAARRPRRSPGAGGASRCSATCWSSASHSAKLHAGLADVVDGTAHDSCFSAGPEMQALARSAAGRHPHGVPRRASEELKPVLLDARAAGRRGHDQIVEGHRLFQAGRCADRSVSGAGRQPAKRA